MLSWGTNAGSTGRAQNMRKHRHTGHRRPERFDWFSPQHYNCRGAQERARKNTKIRNPSNSLGLVDIVHQGEK